MKYNILFSGNYNISNIKINYVPKEPLHSDIQAVIDNRWEAMLQKAQNNKVSLYNSPLFSLTGFDKLTSDNIESIAINLGDTDYKSYSTLRHDHELHKPDPVGTHIILITSDGYIPLIKRSHTVAVNPGKIFTFGGFFDREADWLNGEPNPFLCIQRETKEELGIDLDISLITLLGIIYDNENPHPEISFKAEIPHTKNELLNLCGDEWKEIFFIKTKELKEYLNNESEENFTPTLLAGLHIFSYMD